MPAEKPLDSTVPNLLFSGSAESSFACNGCKKKKIKCNKAAPQCNHCAKSGRTCDYPLSVPKPGPKTGLASRKRQLHDPDSDESDSAQTSGLEGIEVGLALHRSLTDIVHPTQQSTGTSSPENDVKDMRAVLQPSSTGAALAQALQILRITWHDCQSYINSYFENMTAFSLFHRPSFEDKLMTITSVQELEALLLAIIAFAKPFGQFDNASAISDLPISSIWERARYIVRECLDQYIDETPPLHLLQTLALTTWSQLFQGVRSRGWRSVGDCVRICYEMRLHQEDADTQSSRSWIEREERRRAWWAIWELDIFAATMKRLPTSINWTTVQTKLPVPNSSWLSGTSLQTCYFEYDPSKRWKALEKCGNESGQAWCLVLNSYKYEAFLLLTSPQTSALQFVDSGPATPEAIRKYRDMLANCLHCAHLALPETLKIEGRFLGFRPGERDDDAWRYIIHLMLQLAKFMLYRMDVFFRPKNSRGGRKAAKIDNGPSKLAWEQFIASGDETVKLLRNSAPDHVKWINPCVANAIWFGAAALVVGQVLGPTSADRPLSSTNFDLLRATVREYIKISKVPEALLTSLDTLEENLRALTETGLRGLPRGSSASTSESAKSPASGTNSASPAVKTDFDNMSTFQSSQTSQGHTTPGSVGNDFDLFDFPGLDMTQTFNDVDDLWATTADWNFNLDCFRIPYE